jgi:aryl-alcohol dehydrogenase-like predicted oxidoreductase
VLRNFSELLIYITGTQWVMRGDEEVLRADVDYALKELGVEYIDIIVLCRVSPTVPIEERSATISVLDTI